ncbi:MAG TPA: NrfD/PsrC family molybdoenzyme membrane anchor subunit [Acidobacteriota bacterium]|nr:NrfD/PsrC family molybdoenzyme membrane anchor subunit [Acidobacteriota bacterium]
MEVKFARIEGSSTPFYLAMVLLAVFGLAGTFSTYLMHEHGIYLSGMTNRVPWGLQISMAIFYIGLSAGSLVVSGLYGIFGKMEYKPFARIAAYLAMLFLIAGLLSILTDQGRIDRVFVEPFTHFNAQSMFSINPALYSGHIMICVIYLWALFKEKGRLTKIASLTVCLWAIGTHTGTGAIFAFVPRELYNSPLLPPSFVAAALSSGAALMILVIVTLFRATRRPLDNELIIWMGRRLLAVFLLCALYVMLIENAHRVYLVESREAGLFFLFGGFHSVLFWGGLIILGSIIPAIILFIRRTGTSIPWIVFSSCLVVFGVLCERFLIVVPGLIHPPDLFPGMEITGTVVEEGIVQYSLSFLELLQALGVAGIIGFAFLLGLKVLPLAPTEAKSSV